jgi:hypothetical protein
MNKRDFIKTLPVWVAPVVMSVSLPAHAQTSLPAELLDADPRSLPGDEPAPVDGECKDGKVAICHSPHRDYLLEDIDLCVAEPSVKSHLALHGDYLGKCKD